LHWLIGLALLGQMGFGFLLDDLAPPGAAGRTGVINLHKSCGIVLGLAIVVRLLWRWRHRPPVWPPALALWQQRTAQGVHWALYGGMVVMPLSGYVASNVSKYGVQFFGHAWPAWGSARPSVYSFFNGMHEVTAWLFCLLMAVHIGAALHHAWLRHDGILARMWPRATDGTSRRPSA